MKLYEFWLAVVIGISIWAFFYIHPLWALAFFVLFGMLPTFIMKGLDDAIQLRLR